MQSLINVVEPSQIKNAARSMVASHPILMLTDRNILLILRVLEVVVNEHNNYMDCPFYLFSARAKNMDRSNRRKPGLWIPRQWDDNGRQLVA
jgi:hypothetical protein